MKKLLLFAVLLATVLYSCSDEESVLDPAKVGYEYYPLAVGNYSIFNVKEIEYANNAVKEEETYQVREYINATSTDQAGRQWYRVELARRPIGGTNWTVTGVRMISPGKSDLRIMENNKTTVHLVFPAKEGYSWVYNGLYNQTEKLYYTFKNLEKPFTPEGGTTYENTLTVVQDENDDLLSFRSQYEVLAHGKGPIYRYYRNHQYCEGGSGSNCETGIDYIVEGFDRVETLESSGVIN